MNVLVISSLFPRDRDPTRGIFIHRQIRAIRQLGVDARVLCPLAFGRPSVCDRTIPDYQEWDSVPVKYVAYWQVPISVSPALHGRLLLRALRKALRQEFHRADLYHAHWLFPTAWAAVRATRDSGIPTVVSARGSDVHTYPLRSRRLRKLTREAIRAATVATFVSRALAHEANVLGLTELNNEIIYNGVDDELFCPSSDRRRPRRDLGLPEDGLYWVSVSRLTPEKGTEELFRAFSALAARYAHARLILVGDGPEAGSLQKRSVQSGLAGRVIFAGRRAPKEVARWLQAADAFVLASHKEGLPNVVLEAMASGLPVVATDVGGTAEAVLHGISGLLVEPRNMDALSEAIIQISEDSELAAKLGAEGRKRVEQYFGWSASARSCIDVYEKALRMRSR